MDILVCISKTPDTTASVRFKDNNTVYDEAGVQFIMNPFDEFYSLVRAVELKEKLGGTVTVLNVGDASNDIIIRKALAIGADKGVRIDVVPKSAYFTAKQIAEFAKDKNFDLIFLGKETIDFNGGEVQSMTAELLDMPYVHHVSNFELEGALASMERDIEGGVEKIEVKLPMVVGSTKGIAEQRIPNMRGIMMAKRKPLEVVAPIDCEDSIEIVRYELPKQKDGVKLVDPENMEELVRLLHEEAKVI